jgi:hypothetical protein
MRKENGTDLRPPRSTNHEWEKNARLTPVSQAQNTNRADERSADRLMRSVNFQERRIARFRIIRGKKENAWAQRELFHGGLAALVKSPEGVKFFLLRHFRTCDVGAEAKRAFAKAPAET